MTSFNKVFTGIFFIILGFSHFARGLEWRAADKNGFDVVVEIPKTKLSILDNVIVNITLTYPETYNFFPEVLRMHLLYHSAFSISPFTIAKENFSKVETKDGLNTQQLQFILDPQVEGTHSLSFLDIPFETIDSKKDKKVVILSDIFTIEVAKNTPTSSLSLETPLLTFSESFPFELSDANKESGRKRNDLDLITSTFKKKKFHGEELWL